MSLPLSRSTTYLPGATPTIKSADLNALQDGVVGVYTGLKTLAGAALDGLGNNAATRQALLEMIGASTGTAPALLTRNSNAQIRWLIDHNGYPTGGRFDQWTEEWMTTGSSLSGAVAGSTGGFTAVPGTGGSIIVTDPSANYNAKFLAINPTTTSGAATNLYSPTFCFANTAGLSLVLEMDIGLSTTACGTSSKTSFYFGLSNAADIIGSSDNSLCCLVKRYNSSVYQLGTGNGTINSFAATLNSPTAASNPIDRLRIELHGLSSPYGSKAFFYINEVLIGTVFGAGNLPAAVALRAQIYAYAEAGAPVGAPVAYIGPLTATWNRYLAPGAL